jgi:hypothetical protein
VFPKKILLAASSASSPQISTSTSFCSAIERDFIIRRVRLMLADNVGGNPWLFGAITPEELWLFKLKELDDLSHFRVAPLQ